MMEQPERIEFSVRQNWLGQLVLQVRHFDNLPYSGQWVDATSKHLPLFFKRLGDAKP